MALIEAEIEELDNMYADPAISSDTAKLMEIHTRKEALSKELDELYDKWGINIIIPIPKTAKNAEIRQFLSVFIDKITYMEYK